MSKESITMWSRYWLVERRDPTHFIRLTWFNLTHRKEVVRFIKFSIAAGLTVPVGLGSLYLFTEVAGIHYLTSNVISLVLSTLVWWLLHSVWTFRDMQTNILSIPKSLTVRVVVSGIDMLILYVLTIAGLWYMASATIAIAIGFPIGYYLSRRWIWSVKRSLQE